MKRYVAFLRAINVGGHTVKMGRLRSTFESMGFTAVETFIASGNVIFSTKSKDEKALESKIAAKLKTELGYEVAAFIRTNDEIAAIAKYKPFPPADIEASLAFNIAFIADALDTKTERAVLALETASDRFRIHGREIYWLCRKKQSDSKFSNAVLEKTIGASSTIRGARTVYSIAEKLL